MSDIKEQLEQMRNEDNYKIYAQMLRKSNGYIAVLDEADYEDNKLEEMMTIMLEEKAIMYNFGCYFYLNGHWPEDAKEELKKDVESFFEKNVIEKINPSIEDFPYLKQFKEENLDG